jgi:hypothetical protein
MRILTLLLLLYSASLQAQTYTFPKDFIGVWQGDLHIYKGDKIVQTVPMRADNLLTDSIGTYIWALIYGADTIAGKRDYVLKTIDASKGHYIVDEKNGILLDSYVTGNKLTSVFTVMKNTLLTSYERIGDTMIFEVNVYGAEADHTTGNIPDKDIPEVKTYKVIGYQKAVLKRIR